MENKDSIFQKQLEELEKLGIEIEELKILIEKTRGESRIVGIEQINELHLKQEKLILVFLLMKEARSEWII